MFKKILKVLTQRKVDTSRKIINPFDFSHASTLHITVKKDGTKVYRPMGYSPQKGTPKTTITYEDQGD